MKYLLIGAFSISIYISGAELPEVVDFNKHIRPILSDRCYKCHGPDGGEFGESWKGGLRLDIEKGAKANLAEVRLELKNAKRKKEGQEPLPADGKKSFAIMPKNIKDSSLVSRIYTDDQDDLMPPPDSHLKLSEHEKGLLKKWIEQGAEWGHHWSFEPPFKKALPIVKNKNWVKNEIDYFILEKLEKKKISPNPEADKITWLRRVYLDLTGLPPSVEKADKFLADNSPQAYEKVVDELLSTTHYAERMALDWLDNARYADTSGYQYDMPRTMWPWRDWVIMSFRENIPYSEFVTKQLAGDLLPNSTLQDKIATGFNRNHGFTIEGGVIPEEYRVQYVNDRVNTVGTLFLGLTMDCTRCHNHKYDPLTMEDYYSMSAFFDKIDEPGFAGGKPLAVKPMVDYKLYDEQKLAEMEKQISELVKAPLSKEDSVIFENWKEDLGKAPAENPVTSVVSTGGATVVSHADFSYEFTEKNPDKDTYIFTMKIPKGKYSSLILEVLPTDNGLGRSENGNAVLSSVEVLAGKNKIDLADVIANHSQNGFPVNSLLKGKGKGWGIGGDEDTSKRLAVFGFKNGVTQKDGVLTVKLNFTSDYAKHSFAKVRLTLSEKIFKDAYNFEIFKDKVNSGKIDEAKVKEEFIQNSAVNSSVSVQIKELRKKIDEEKKKVVQVMVMEEKPGVRETFILERGEYDKKGQKVKAHPPRFLSDFSKYPQNRLGFAQWLTANDNPLFARVTINRYWQMLFGYGLVKSSEDFGAQGDEPSHPELMDWLAVDFRENGWDLRKFFKKIVLSATYRQSSKVRSELEDSENRLIAQGPRFRLTAEFLRDQALFVAGQLSDKVGGPSVYPYQPAGIWLDLTNRPGFQMFYTQSNGDDLYRKSLYTFWKRAMPNPSMTALDAPTRDVCIVKRDRTNTPLQALALLHDPTFVEASRILADKMLRRNFNSIEERISATFREVLVRQPSSEETEILKAVYENKLATFNKKPEQVVKQLAVGEYKHKPGLNETELAAMTAVCQVLFNLSEAVTRN